MKAEYFVTGPLPYFAEFQLAGRSAERTPTEAHNNAPPSTPFEISSSDLKSGILDTKFPTEKPLMMNAIEVANLALRYSSP